MRTSPLVFVLAALSLDCATLTPIPEGTCGNGVVDANEDCDSFPDTCGKAGSGTTSCRLTCDRKQASSCPSGWGCSVEGFCRQATGTFEAAGGPSSAGVLTLLVGDFDGDGRADLLGGGPKNGTSKPRVHFYDSNGTPAPPVSLQFAMTAPVVRDVDLDGRDDLAFAINASDFGGIGVLAGTADRAFSPVLFPTVQKAATALAFVTLPHDPAAGYALPTTSPATITVERTASGTAFRSISEASLIGVAELELTAPMGPEQVVGLGGYGHLYAPSPTNPSTCGDVVFPYNVGEEGHLAILTPCSNLTPWTKRAARDVKLPAKIAAPGVLVVDNPGGYATIFVTTVSGTYVATSTGVDLGPIELLTVSDDKGLPIKIAAPLAAADIDLDGKGDLVFPNGLFASRTPGVPADPDAGAGQGSSVPPTTGRWADARIGNLNGDAFPDLVAFSPEALEIELFANSGKGTYTRFTVSSSLPVRAMTIGDFDGDRIQDVAFLASSRALGDEEVAGETELLVAYGKASGGPEPARVVGRFKEARGLATLHDFEEPVDNLFVFETTPAAAGLPTSSLTYLFNSGDRQSQAPLIFRDGAAIEPAGANRLRLWLPATLVAGSFLTAGSVDVMAIAYGITARTTARAQGESIFVPPFPTGAWFAQGDKAATGGLRSVKELVRFNAAEIKALDANRFENEGILETLIVSAAGDIDSPPNGVTEIVSLVRSPKGSSTELLIVRGSDLMSAKAPPRVELGDFVVNGQDEVSLVDVDNDDLPDLVVLARGKNRDKLRIYLNDAKGSFLVTPINLDLGANETAAGFARVVTGVLPSGRPRGELAIATQSRLLLGSISADRSRLETRDVSTLLGVPLSNRLTGVAAGDFDGDGVQDLAVADSGSIRVLRQQPRLR